ncbi:MAG: hypothetical protein AAF196_03220 [Planctomycetota bacterium]
MKRALNIAGVAALLSLGSGCANRASTEVLHRSENAHIGVADVALLPVIVEDDGPTFFYYLALPLIWVARTIQLDFTTDNLEPEEGADVLRDLCYLALEQATSNADPVPLPLVDRIVQEKGITGGDIELFDALYDELGANYFVTIYLERWGSDYYVLETRNNVRARVEIHSRELGYGEPLLTAIVTGNDGEGVSGGPTGFFDLAIAPLAGVDTGPVLDLAAQVALGIGKLIGGLEESVELTDPPEVQDVESRLEPLGEDLHRFTLSATSDLQAQLSYRIEGLTGYVSMEPIGEPTEDGKQAFSGSLVAENLGDSIGCRLRLRASTPVSRRATDWYRTVEEGPVRPYDEPRVPETIPEPETEDSQESATDDG